MATIEKLDETFLVMNGDILTDLDYTDLIRAHEASDNALTIASHRRVVKTDYGVLHTDENRVVDYEEKPEIDYIVSIGVYVIEPHVIELVPHDRHFDMPDVVRALIDAHEPVGTYLFDGFWLDIGRHEDYEMAIAKFDEIKDTLLPSAALTPHVPTTSAK